ncbi:MAG: OpgC domain-containing protein [Verrucomicrobia bacterium]|nr:OpgC domain-containing protein [Verrucomicrobiota bacterium]MDE3098555.1 OpgC domain-containing protein [Verrucomicrobiota bacterium]
MNSRDIRLDTLRGCFLLLMAAVHVPTPVSHALQEPLGCNGAAEGFIFLSACLAGLVYGRRYMRTDWGEMSGRVWGRVKWIYLVHVALLLPIALIAWMFSDRVAPFANHFHDFLVHPWGALALMPLLLHQPPLFDILPLYIIFLGITPFILALARRCGWAGVLGVSALIWLVVQGRLDARVVGDPSRWLPLQLGSFDLLAWQFLWICGVAVGETSLRRPLISPKLRSGVAAVASCIALTGVLWRHGIWPDAWSSPQIILWMDKWTLGPLRLLDFAAWAALLMAWNPRPPQLTLAPTALLGRHSLAVFALHLPLVIAATALIQMFTLSNAAQTVIGLGVMALLFPWAAWLDRRKSARLDADVSFKPPVPPMRMT